MNWEFMQGQIIQGESKPELLFLLMIYCPIIRYISLVYISKV